MMNSLYRKPLPNSTIEFFDTRSAIPGTLVNLATGGGKRDSIRFGHPSGTLKVGAQAKQTGDSEWQAIKATMSRSARILMEGSVHVPDDNF